MRRIVNPAIYLRISLFIFAFLLIPSINMVAQNGRKALADNYFSYLDYSKAAPIYNELADKSIKDNAKGKVQDYEVIRRAAICNYNTRIYKKSADYYNILVNDGQASIEDLKNYFETLRYLGEYKKAELYLDTLKSLDSTDNKVVNYKRQLNYFDALKRDSSRFTVKDMPFNTGMGDFGPAFYEKGLVYASSRKKGAANNIYGWDYTDFLNSYYTEKDGEEFSKRGTLLKSTFETTPHDGPIFYSKDGKTAYITRNRVEKDQTGQYVQLSIYIAQKGANGKWGTPQPFPYNNKSYSVGHAALSPNGKTLYFASDMPGSVGGVDIWKSDKQGGGWSKPINLGNLINTPDDDMFPYISDEGNLYFASKGHIGLGGLDVFEARKAGNTFMAPINMGYPINTNYDDFALITEKNGSVGYFSSDRKENVDRIYSVNMRRILINLEGIVRDSTTKEPIKNATVIIRNLTLSDSLVIQTNEKGEFSAPLMTEADYQCLAQKDYYSLIRSTSVTTKGITESTTLKTELWMIPGNEPLAKNGANSGTLVIRVVDCESNDKIEGLTMTLIDTETGVEKKVKTNEKGEILITQSGKDLPVSREFAVVSEALEMDASGNTYKPAVKKVYFIYKGSEPNRTVSREICLNRLEKGDEMDLKDVYFDFDKWNLRPLSIVQLDKAYRYLMKNPDAKFQLMLSGNTDSRATHEYNVELSRKRMQVCIDYLVKVKKVPADRLVGNFFGEERLVNKCADNVPCSEEEHQMNRRTEIRVVRVQ